MQPPPPGSRPKAAGPAHHLCVSVPLRLLWGSRTHPPPVSASPASPRRAAMVSAVYKFIGAAQDHSWLTFTLAPQELGFFRGIGRWGRPNRRLQGPPAHSARGRPATTLRGRSGQARPGSPCPSTWGAADLGHRSGATNPVPPVCAAASLHAGSLAGSSVFTGPGPSPSGPPPPRTLFQATHTLNCLWPLPGRARSSAPLELPLRSAGLPFHLRSGSATAVSLWGGLSFRAPSSGR
ncbi:hypothetical protein NDU88_004437 [Pleurodeles waltl]|uniref:Uncharacterized protein n=1 Tax=Pleurodeles waltl TaxID=8319 RepID=A0AAV7MTG1_PLEWA|nr:hypothetical protein NDU88_004437 [Pleurodeles waltl]